MVPYNRFQPISPLHKVKGEFPSITCSNSNTAIAVTDFNGSSGYEDFCSMAFGRSFSASRKWSRWTRIYLKVKNNVHLPSVSPHLIGPLLLFSRKYQKILQFLSCRPSIGLLRTLLLIVFCTLSHKLKGLLNFAYALAEFLCINFWILKVVAYGFCWPIYVQGGEQPVELTLLEFFSVYTKSCLNRIFG